MYILINSENANITALGFKTLVTTHLPNLKTLYLANNQIGDCEIE